MDKKNLVDKGADVAGSVLGAGIGVSIIGPAGALWGAAIGPVVTNVIKDISKRFLSPREKTRLDNAIFYMKEGIESELKAGKIPRQDDFFVGTANFSGNANELFEGVLLKCKSAYQEKKVKLISNILTNVTFDPSITAETVYHTLSLAEQLSYHELCLLSYFGRKNSFENFELPNIRIQDLTPDQKRDNPDFRERIQDILSMMRQSIVLDGRGSTHLVGDTIAASTMELDRRGAMVYKLLNLEEIPKEDVLAILKPLSTIV